MQCLCWEIIFVWLVKTLEQSAEDGSSRRCGGSIGRASASNSNGFHDQRFKFLPEHKKTLWEVCFSQNVVLTRCRCAPPPYAHIRTYAHWRSCSPCQCSVDYGNMKTPHTGNNNKNWVAPYYDCLLSAGKAARIFRALHWDKKMISSNLI